MNTGTCRRTLVDQFARSRVEPGLQKTDSRNKSMKSRRLCVAVELLLASHALPINVRHELAQIGRDDTSHRKSRNAAYRLTSALLGGCSCAMNTTVISFTGSTQNVVLAPPPQLYSPRKTGDPVRWRNDCDRAAQSEPKPLTSAAKSPTCKQRATRPAAQSAGGWSSSLSLTASDKTRVPLKDPPCKKPLGKAAVINYCGNQAPTARLARHGSLAIDCPRPISRRAHATALGGTI